MIVKRGTVLLLGKKWNRNVCICNRIYDYTKAEGDPVFQAIFVARSVGLCRSKVLSAVNSVEMVVRDKANHLFTG
jgi:hypothetical protein